MPLPFARISFVPTTSLSCLEKSGRQRCVCAHEKTRTKSMSCIGTAALQLFFCTVDGYMQLDDNTGIACSNMDASICFGGRRYWRLDLEHERHMIVQGPLSMPMKACN